MNIFLKIVLYYSIIYYLINWIASLWNYFWKDKICTLHSKDKIPLCSVIANLVETGLNQGDDWLKVSFLVDLEGGALIRWLQIQHMNYFKNKKTCGKTHIPSAGYPPAISSGRNVGCASRIRTKELFVSCWKRLSLSSRFRNILHHLRYNFQKC